MNRQTINLSLLTLFVFIFSCATQSGTSNSLTKEAVELTSRTSSDDKKPRIQAALLLDTSNSMDGLINQAKSQLWKMVNDLATTKQDGKIPTIEIALYEYGNSTLSVEQGYVRQIVPLSADLDLVSEKLFELSTNGGDEYCGQVVHDAAKDLAWTTNNNDLKLIIIAGNEPYDQGPYNYKTACKEAITKGIMINTIHCGAYEEGVETHWKDGADCADGKYMNINQDDEVVHIPTPYDDKILELNQSLNSTYISYGAEGKKRKARQEVQDANASSFSAANSVERAVSKSSAQYKNEEWDLIDAASSDEEFLEEVEEEALPEEMQKMDKEERKEYLVEKKEEREKIQAEINTLNTKRKEFIAKEQKNNAEKQTLDNVLIKAVREQAKSKNFKYE